MEIYSFDPDNGFAVDRFGSRFRITPILRQEGTVQVGYAHLPADGLIGRHEAASNQLLVVTAGEGWVSGHDGVQHTVRAGQAAFWLAGELHETGTAAGLSAMILEGPDLQPARRA